MLEPIDERDVPGLPREKSTARQDFARQTVGELVKLSPGTVAEVTGMPALDGDPVRNANKVAAPIRQELKRRGLADRARVFRRGERLFVTMDARGTSWK